MTDKTYRIVNLQVENAMRISAVDITPKGDLVEIAGANEQGKTSLMQAIEWVLRGATAIPDAPIKTGKDKASVRIRLGGAGEEIILTRVLRKRADGSTDQGQLRVEAANGARFKDAHHMLQSMLGKLSIDPISFANSKPEDQIETMKRFVPNIDFAGIEGKNDADYEARTEVNRRAREARAAADLIAYPIDTPDAPVDEAALVDELAKAGEQNAAIQTRKDRRAAAAEKVVADTNMVALLRGRIDVSVKEIADRRDQRIRELEAEMSTVRERAERDMAAAKTSLTQEADDLEAAVTRLQHNLDTADPLPPPIDTAELQGKIAAARKTNADVALKQRKATLLAEAKDCEAESEKLTETMNARTAAKEKAIAESKLPVPGIGFGKDKKGNHIVTLNGLPFAQASKAVQLRTSLRIAMADSPQLRVILIRNGNDLDANGVKIITDMAAEHRYQVWMETCHPGERPAFIIEDGRLAGAPAAEPQEAA